jgi:hypothetical protein
MMRGLYDIVERFFDEPFANIYIYFQEVDESEWVSRLCALISPLYPHCSLVFENYKGLKYNIDLTWAGVQISYLNEIRAKGSGNYLFKANQYIEHDEVPMEYVLESLKEKILALSLCNAVTPSFWRFFRYPFMKVKPFVCTGFVQLLLCLEVDNCTPTELFWRLRLEDEPNSRKGQMS